jgi:hypothetical protein
MKIGDADPDVRLCRAGRQDAVRQLGDFKYGHADASRGTVPGSEMSRLILTALVPRGFRLSKDHS